jgi:hypothetical protein
MAAAAADSRPEEVEGNQEILDVQNLDYSGLYYAITDENHDRGDGVFNPNPHTRCWGLTDLCLSAPNMTMYYFNTLLTTNMTLVCERIASWTNLCL